jgi:hypothetical protein
MRYERLHTCFRRAALHPRPLVAARGARPRDAAFVEDPFLERLNHLSFSGAVDDAAGNPGRDVLVDEELAHQYQQVLYKI